MRLINIHTLELEEFIGDAIPPYLILSHRWTKDEITYKDFRKGRRKDSAGYQKIVQFCGLVKDWVTSCNLTSSRIDAQSRDGPGSNSLQHVWVDTCCINKDSSAELTEAINSMYRWYRQAHCCFAHLADVPANSSMEAIRGSEWFMRGWTLQELLAPDLVIFCDQNWRLLGRVGHTPPDDYWRSPRSTFLSRSSYLGGPIQHLPDLTDQVSAASGIAKKHLHHDGLNRILISCSIAEKMSWAANRRTTRVEDQAYCLMGLFGVNMPLLYGEGGKAFQRLQQELIKASNDQSIFAFIPGVFPGAHGIFAHQPFQFEHSGQVQRGEPCEPYELTNRGLRLVVEYIDVPVATYGKQEVLIRLNCSVKDNIGRSKRGESEGSDNRHVPGLPYNHRPVMTTLVKHKSADQWYRGSFDNLGIMHPLRDPDAFFAVRPGHYPRLDFEAKLEELRVTGKWQEPRVFFVDA